MALVRFAIVFLLVGFWQGRHAFAVDSAVRSFVNDHCYDCHSGPDAESGLDLESLGFQAESAGNLATWTKIHDRIAAGEMPPPEYEELSPESRAPIVGKLAKDLCDACSEKQNRDGRVQFRRLNRFEYESSLRDLLDLPNLEVREMLPPDASRHGFDNVGSALDVSYVQMSRYLDAAAVALDEATRLGPKPDVQTQRWLMRDNGRFGQILRKQVEAVPVGDAVGVLRQPNSAQSPLWLSKFAPQSDGRYRIRAKVFGFIWDQGKVMPADRIHAVTYQAVRGTMKRALVTKDIVRRPEEHCIHQFDAFLRVGDEIQFWFGTLDDRNKKKTPIDQYTAPGVAIEWVEIEGPIISDWPPPSHRRLFGDLPVKRWAEASGLKRPEPPMTVKGVGKRALPQRVGDKDFVPFHVVSSDPAADSRRLLADFASAAFRRPVHADELVEFQQLVDAKLTSQVCFDEAMRVGYLAVLCSPEFLFLREQPGRLDDHAIATRLSLFLWSSLPDQELRDLADQDRLLEHLPEQVERMLDDPRVERLIENFAGQWLDLRRINVTEPDEQLYPEYDRLLLASMVLETRAYFAEMLRSDLSIQHVVDSDFAMLNQRLAEHYEVPGVEGFDIRKVALPSDSPRGGFITQASVLKVTANGTTTSPVTRGAWFLDRILGQPAPPPPPGIPAVEPDLRGATTIRQQLEVHRKDEACAGCHRSIDPPGFALESFDVIGGFRQQYRTLGAGDDPMRTFKDDRRVAYKLGPPVDCSGELPGGDSFAGMDEFRDRLKSRKHQIARNLIEKLLIYATGEGVQFCDRQVIDQMVDKTIAGDDGLRTVIHRIVQSELFQKK